MKRTLRSLVISLIFVSLTFAAPRAQAAAMREFILSCTYGVLAGTMMGAATLAFTERPSDHLHRVARGASLGLYAGILLGAYVVFVVDPEGGTDNGEEEALPEGLGWNKSFQLNSVHQIRLASRSAQQPAFELRPVINDQGDGLVVDGASMHLQVLNF
jgi:hypothetical protein